MGVIGVVRWSRLWDKLRMLQVRVSLRSCARRGRCRHRRVVFGPNPRLVNAPGRPGSRFVSLAIVNWIGAGVTLLLWRDYFSPGARQYCYANEV